METLEPNKSRIKKWVAALRSGRYRQVQCSLSAKQPDGSFSYCCLGVAQLVARREGGPNCKLAGRLFLNQKVAKWFGLTTQDPILKEKSATHWNDVAKKDFSEIADLIEKEFLS